MSGGRPLCLQPGPGEENVQTQFVGVWMLEGMGICSFFCWWDYAVGNSEEVVTERRSGH